jgi:hypothetical protein
MWTRLAVRPYTVKAQVCQEKVVAEKIAIALQGALTECDAYQ